MGVEIRYRDIAPYAKKDLLSSEAEDKQPFVDMDQLKRDALAVGKYATLEQDYWYLDGSFTSFPDNPETCDMGWWSEQMSGEDGSFASEIILTRTFEHQHTSVGISLTFDTFAEDYCASLNVKWYRDNRLLYSKDYQPNAAVFYCAQNVENFNKIIITFYSMNRPYRYLKVSNIDDGVIRNFTAGELRSVKVLEEVSPISEELSINTLSFELDSAQDTEYLFQKKQPLEVRFNDELIGIYYVDKADRAAKSQYSVSAEDYIGLLDKVRYYGGIYTDITVEDLVEEIMAGENIEFVIDENLCTYKLSGYLPICTKREALAQVAFACGGIVDDSGSSTLRIYHAANQVSSLSASDTFDGGKVTSGDIITEVHLTSYSYYNSYARQELFKGSVEAGDTLITFQEPACPTGMQVEGAQLLYASYNYCVVNAVNEQAEVIISGYRYQANTKQHSMKNPNILMGAAENIIEVQECTLISESNASEVLERVYNHYINNQTVETKAVLHSEKAGELLHVVMPWQGEYTGRIVKNEMDLRYKKIANIKLKVGDV